MRIKGKPISAWIKYYLILFFAILERKSWKEKFDELMKLQEGKKVKRTTHSF